MGYTSPESGSNSQLIAKVVVNPTTIKTMTSPIDMLVYQCDWYDGIIMIIVQANHSDYQ
jgi:hypothetical protein